MESTMTAIEVTGTIDANHQLHLDSELPVTGPMAVRVIVLCPAAPDVIDETAWLKSAAANPAFAYLQEAEEDIYSIADGKPVQYEV